MVLPGRRLSWKPTRTWRSLSIGGRQQPEVSLSPPEELGRTASADGVALAVRPLGSASVGFQPCDASHSASRYSQTRCLLQGRAGAWHHHHHSRSRWIVLTRDPCEFRFVGSSISRPHPSLATSWSASSTREERWWWISHGSHSSIQPR